VSQPADLKNARLTVIICSGPVCRDQRGSDELRAHLDATVAARGLGDRITVASEVCLGHCLRGPNVIVHDEPADAAPATGLPDPTLVIASPRSVLYNRMTIADLDRVIERHLAGGMAIRPLMNRPPFRGR
jgi:(2Fe-2S) ferredoxin